MFVFSYRSQKPKAKKAKTDGGNEPESDVFAFSEENEEFLDAETIVDQADAEAAAAEGAKKPTKRWFDDDARTKNPRTAQLADSRLNIQLIFWKEKE